VITHLQSLPPGVELRELNEKSDIGLLFNIYASTREDITSYAGFNQKQKEEFLNNQFWLQHNAYMKNYDNPLFLIIKYQEKDVGRLYISITNDELRIIDIAILPQARGVGIGTALLTNLLEQVKKDAKKVTIHVEKQNRALNLYKRLGFVCVEEGSVYNLMEKPI
jgi:ribosomal protein S18 acetylase RimI-like enzyme